VLESPPPTALAHHKGPKIGAIETKARGYKRT
jgi:hypothetical protein